MGVRYVLTMPPEVRAPEDLERFSAMWREAVNQRQAVSVMVSHGVTVQDMGLHFDGVPAKVRRARALHR